MNSHSAPASDLLALIQERRSIRRLEPRPVPRPIIERLLEAARWGPSAHNRQPWRFIVLTADSEKHVLASAMATRLAADLRADGVDEALIEKDTGRSCQRMTGAGALIVVCLTMAEMDRYPDRRRQELEHIMAVQSTSMAGQNLLLMAHAEGLGAVWMCGALFCPGLVRETLDLPADWEPQGIIALGWPGEQRTKTRQPLDDRVIWR